MWSEPDLPDLHGVVLGLGDALGGAQLGPVPVAAVVAPPPPLAHQHVARVAVELDLGARGEGERRLSPVPGCGKLTTGDYLNTRNNIEAVTCVRV